MAKKLIEILIDYKKWHLMNDGIPLTENILMIIEVLQFWLGTVNAKSIVELFHEPK